MTYEIETPGEIRAALLPEEQVEFDQAWRRAMIEAADRAAAALIGEDIPVDEPLAVTKARLGY